MLVYLSLLLLPCFLMHTSYLHTLIYTHTHSHALICMRTRTPSPVSRLSSLRPPPHIYTLLPLAHPQGKKGGALGFVKGIGLGFAGVLTKPLLGVSDGISSVAHGISNQVSDVIVISVARPPRAFDRSAVDILDRVLVPLDLAAASAQAFVTQCAQRGGYADTFLFHVNVDGSRHGCFTDALATAKTYIAPGALHNPPQAGKKPPHAGVGADHAAGGGGGSGGGGSGSSSCCGTGGNGGIVNGSGSDIGSGSGSGSGGGGGRGTDKSPLYRGPAAIARLKSGVYEGSSALISALYVFVLSRDESILGRFSFGEISHCVFQGSNNSVGLVLYQAHDEWKNKVAGQSQLGGKLDMKNFKMTMDQPLHVATANAFRSVGKEVKRGMEDMKQGGHHPNHLFASPASPSPSASTPAPASTIAPSSTPSTEGPTLISIICRSRPIAVRLYRHLAQCAPSMGNPSSVLAPDVATPSSPEDPHSTWTDSPLGGGGGGGGGGGVGGSVGGGGNGGQQFQGYRFGTANVYYPIPSRGAGVPGVPPIVPPPPPGVPPGAGVLVTLCKEKDFFSRAAHRLAEPVPVSHQPSGYVSADVYQGLLQVASLAFARHADAVVWQTVLEWRVNHTQLHEVSRCCAVLVINQSDNPVQILRLDMQEGKNAVIWGIGATVTSAVTGPDTMGYDSESRTIMGGGGAGVVFAYGFVPTPIDPGHVKVGLLTSAFHATVSTRPNSTVCAAVGGYTAGYLEKSLSDYWAKFVIVVS